MKIYNRYILSLTLLFLVTTVIISASNRGLDFYFSIYLIECLVLTLLFSQINPKARKGLNNIGYVLFSGFLVLVGMKVVEIITGTNIL